LLLLYWGRPLRANTDSNGNHFPHRYAHPDDHAGWRKPDTDSERNANGIGNANCFRYANSKRDPHRKCNTNR